MIKNWLITGDTHGKILERISHIDEQQYPPTETALIILGDAGFNFYLNKTDWKLKRNTNNTGYTIYCVRGNHEERPENLKIPLVYDKEVNGLVYCEKEFPNIKYFLDGGSYNIKGYSVVTIGGAYSIDKWHRIGNKNHKTTWTGWFKDEQLTYDERQKITRQVKNKSYDFVLTHTCPYTWRPTDLFLSFVDATAIDPTMELWLEELKNKINYNIWLFGHFHADRFERPKCEIFYKNIEEIDNIYNRWNAEDGLIKKLIYLVNPKYYNKEEV